MSNIPNITSFEILETQIAKVGGKPTVLEVLWDGDTQGWFLRLSIYTTTEKLSNTQLSAHYLGYMKLGTDFRLFVGGEWTEASLAKEFGQKAIEKYGLEFYFPSPDEPDDDCPEWTERHLAINCADCSKLIIPTDSPYSPKDICYNCHLKRKKEEEIIKDVPYNDGVSMFLLKDTERVGIGSCSYFESFPIAPFVKAKVESQLKNSNKAVHIVLLEQNDILELEQDLKKVLHQCLENYVKPAIDPSDNIRKFFYKIRTLEYNGVEYELQDAFNENHERILKFIYSLKTAQKALAENYIYEIYFKKDITYRDDNILRFTRYANQGTTEIDNVKARYKNILAENELLRTIEKLQNIGCLLRTDNKLTITDIGKCII
jgi:hypothetical protein